MKQEEFYQEVAGLYDQNYKKLDEGEPCALLNLVRLSNLYAVACVCYYEHDFSPMEDHTFDDLCRFLLEFYDQAIEEGVWSGVLDKEMLAAGSGYHQKNFRLPIKNIAYCVTQVGRRRRYVSQQNK
jgi:hypothetical protein